MSIPANIMFSQNMKQIPNNGRVIDAYSQTKPYELFTENNNDSDTFKNIALTNIQEKSPLSQVYFSNANMKRVQNMIRYHVWLKSGKRHVIGEQSYIELEIIMRAIYLQFSKNLQCNIGEQVQELDQMVVDWCWPKILTEVEQHLVYLDGLNRLPQEIELPKNVSSAGTKTLRSVTTTF